MRKFMPALVIGPILALALAMPAAAAGNSYSVERLVSDQPGKADFTDPNLINGWGLAAGPTTPWWVAAEGTDKALVYGAEGDPIPLVVDVNHGPTGEVYNGTADFVVNGNGESGPALFMFASMDGRIRGWNPDVGVATPSTHAYVVADRHGAGAVYTGLAINHTGGQNYIYAADFLNGRIDVFNGSFTRQNWAGKFTDPDLPDEFSPFGIQAIDGYVFVTYAEQEGNTDEEVIGRHLGYVDAYSAGGDLIARVATRGPLNAPWGVAWAPDDFGPFSGDLLVGNFGNGRIHAYRQTSTGWVLDGVLRKPNGNPVAIDGLWAIAFGNDGPAGDHDELYFTAGPDDEAHGLFGYIEH
ncbi:MAG: hypothetical protein QOJ81_1443 [Chloroflexota bacterium]|jgi:uncharacterized protein (TIGR03118 family)|nr:hypothetical protein [Chloroflexota bacterium]